MKNMKALNKTLKFQTKGLFDFVDITNEIKKNVDEGQIKNGLVNIQILHTSASLILNENEPLLIEDFKENLERTASKDLKYRHDNLNERTVNLCSEACVNGHAHCKAIHLPVNITLNLIEGKLQLGQWQRIFIVELDQPRQRTVQVQILGI
ncbi:secondary thiamine-phosphate synthase enzyme YjbQ [Patescibacteria group bacterium]|nr:secondary thiamine-phosphate synthase enzyme YjbQ [Patescibacteria group bacterium]